MKKARSVIFLIPLLLLSCSWFAWGEYSSEKGGFSILLPGIPEEQTETVSTALGDIRLTILMAQPDETAIYFVSYSDYPAEAVSATDPDSLLASAMISTVDSQNGTLGGYYKIALVGRPGLAFSADVKIEGRDAILRARNYIVGNRLYQVFAMAYREADSTEDMSRFLGSFRLAEDS